VPTSCWPTSAGEAAEVQGTPEEKKRELAERAAREQELQRRPTVAPKGTEPAERKPATKRPRPPACGHHAAARRRAPAPAPAAAAPPPALPGPGPARPARSIPAEMKP